MTRSSLGWWFSISAVAAAAVACEPSAEVRDEAVAGESSSGAESAQTEPGEAPPVLSRPRFQHVPTAYSELEVRASKIELVFVDKRTNVRAAQVMVPALDVPADGEQVEVGVPAGYDALVRDRLARVVSGQGPVLTLTVEIKKLAASRHAQTRRLDVDLGVMIQSADGRTLVQGGAQGNKELFGPAYDANELDDLHRAACLDAIDVFLASESNLALINQYTTAAGL